MKAKRFQLVIKNVETKEYVLKETNFDNESDAIVYFKQCWNDEYFILVDINEIMNGDDIAIEDVVEIIHIDEEDCTENLTPFLGEKGVIVKIDPNWEYPYLIKFEKNKLNNPEYLWKREQIRAV